MNTFFRPLALVAAFALSAASVPVRAETSALGQYFRALQGHWNAQGALISLDAAGNSTEARYRADIRVDRERAPDFHGSQGEWSIDNDLRFDSGLTQRNQSYYRVAGFAGDTLFVAANGALEPVQIIESTPLSLSYKIRRSDFLTGRIFDLTFSVWIDGSRRRLEGRNTVETNGVVISDENYSAKKW